jgi:hypothetical protein
MVQAGRERGYRFIIPFFLLQQFAAVKEQFCQAVWIGGNFLAFECDGLVDEDDGQVAAFTSGKDAPVKGIGIFLAG